MLYYTDQIMMSLFCLLCLLFSQVKSGNLKRPLNDFIAHYETLNYAARSKVYRRSSDSVTDGIKHTVDFNAHGRKFTLSLRPDRTTLAPGATIIDGYGKRIEFDRDALSVGELIGEPGSKVHGLLDRDGIFTGKIYSKDGIYFVETAERYFGKPVGFHSVIYKDEDVKYDVRFSSPKVAPLESYREGISQPEFDQELSDMKRRERRDTTPGSSFKNNMCLLSMEADYTFVDMAKGATLAVGEILKHVQALNIIYGQTFNTSETYAPYSIQFHVGFLQVYDEKTTPASLKPQNIDISTFLSRMAKKDYSKFCEAVYFTHRDFEGGILGLAWIGYPKNRAGGMCDPRRGSNSYNTAVVTFTLYGRSSPPKVSEITFAHEVGHSFGAEHDDDSCTPGGTGGNYIMYAKATSGDRDRNDRFSPCSIRQIMANVNAKRARVIDHSAKPRQRRCLESRERMMERASDLCGNGVIEGDEECDCGPKAYCEVFEPGGCCDWKTCKLKSPGIICSPSQGPCCGKNCKPTPDAVCEQASDCLQAAKCPDAATLTSKKDFICPSQKNQPDDTNCAGGAFLCQNGLCSKSVCTKYGLTPCECQDRDEECHACCMDGKVCRSAYKIEVMRRPTPYNYSVGTPCANNTGYCDFFQYCQRVDLEGPLRQLFNLYFTSEGIKELTQKYWWAILLGTLGMIAIVVLLVMFGARYTGTDSPDGIPAKPLPKFCCGRQTDATDTGDLQEQRPDERRDRNL